MLNNFCILQILQVVLEQVMIWTDGIKPAQFLIDFEQGFMKAATEVLGAQTKLSGCYFHFKDAIFKKVH